MRSILRSVRGLVHILIVLVIIGVLYETLLQSAKPDAGTATAIHSVSSGPTGAGGSGSGGGSYGSAIQAAQNAVAQSQREANNFSHANVNP